MKQKNMSNLKVKNTRMLELKEIHMGTCPKHSKKSMQKEILTLRKARKPKKYEKSC